MTSRYSGYQAAKFSSYNPFQILAKQAQVRNSEKALNRNKEHLKENCCCNKLSNFKRQASHLHTVTSELLLVLQSFKSGKMLKATYLDPHNI